MDVHGQPGTVPSSAWGHQCIIFRPVLYQPQPRHVYRIREVPVYIENRWPSEERERSSTPPKRTTKTRQRPKLTETQPRKTEADGRAAVRVAGGYRVWGKSNEHEELYRGRKMPAVETDSDEEYSDDDDVDSSPPPRRPRTPKRAPVRRPASPKKPVPAARKHAAKSIRETRTLKRDEDSDDEPLHYDDDDGYPRSQPSGGFPQVWYLHPPSTSHSGCGCQHGGKSRRRTLRATSDNRTRTTSSRTHSLGLLRRDLAELSDAALTRLTLLASRGISEAEDDD